VNGTLVAPAVDWTDAAVIVPVTEAGRSAFKAGPNIVAVHCRDADGGTNVDIAFYVGMRQRPAEDKFSMNSTR
jgi:uncharacterized protein (DUF849 family)